VIGEACVPPDSGVDIFGKLLASLIGAGFAGGAVLVNEIGTGDHHLGGFAFAGVHVDLGLLCWTALLGRAFVENVDHVVVRLVELGLGEVREQALVAAMAVDNQNFLAAVARPLVGSLLQQGELKAAAVRHGSGFVTCLCDLAEIIFGENDGILLVGGVQRGVADVKQVGAER